MANDTYITYVTDHNFFFEHCKSKSPIITENNLLDNGLCVNAHRKTLLIRVESLR
jgi:hypothetical protein